MKKVIFIAGVMFFTILTGCKPDAKKAIEKAEDTELMNGCDIEWWKAVSRVVRNKSAH